MSNPDAVAVPATEPAAATPQTPPPTAAPRKVKTSDLFKVLRTDPKKAEKGVWIEHPETGDRFLVGRMFGARHARAFLAAQRQYEAEHGKGTAGTDDAVRWISASSMATGLIFDWKLKDAPDRPYDEAMMAGALNDPELVDLVRWFEIQTQGREHFRPDPSGN